MDFKKKVVRFFFSEFFIKDHLVALICEIRAFFYLMIFLCPRNDNGWCCLDHLFGFGCLFRCGDWFLCCSFLRFRGLWLLCCWFLRLLDAASLLCNGRFGFSWLLRSSFLCAWFFHSSHFASGFSNCSHWNFYFGIINTLCLHKTLYTAPSSCSRYMNWDRPFRNAPCTK